MFLVLVVAAIGGLLIGSFLNVVAWRVPRGESIVKPGSHCPGCDHPVRPSDNIPVVSWLRLHGRCRDCGEPISRRYPAVEATTGLLFVLVVAVHFDDTTRLVLGLAMVCFLVPLALIDLDTRLAAEQAHAAGGDRRGRARDARWTPPGEVERLVAGAAAGGFFLLAALAYPRGMGMGDVKLAAVLGLFLGREVAAALLIGLVAGVVVGVAIMSRKGVAEGRKTAVPFGPFLALGGVVALLVGEGLVDAYLDTF